MVAGSALSGGLVPLEGSGPGAGDSSCARSLEDATEATRSLSLIPSKCDLWASALLGWLRAGNALEGCSHIWEARGFGSFANAHLEPDPLWSSTWARSTFEMVSRWRECRDQRSYPGYQGMSD